MKLKNRLATAFDLEMIIRVENQIIVAENKIIELTD